MAQTPERLPPADRAGLSIDDAGTYLGVKRSTIYGLLKAGKIKSVKIGARHVVLRESCDDFLKSFAA